jgi:predicted nucleic acid-binding protein
MKVFLDANICLDLLDSSRSTAKKSIDWYMQNKDKIDVEFYFSGDFVTTIYYHLTQKRKLDGKLVIEAIDKLCAEIEPIYLTHADFQLAKKSFFDSIFDDFEDLMVLHSAVRFGCDNFLTNDKRLAMLGNFATLKVSGIYYSTTQ